VNAWGFSILQSRHRDFSRNGGGASFAVCTAVNEPYPQRSAPGALFRIPLQAAAGYRIIFLIAVFMEASSCIARSRRLAARFS
jgi:hypothetical protein